MLAGGIGFSAYYALSSALSGVDPAGGVFSGIERVVVVIVTVIAAALVALLAGRLLLTVTSGAVARRRGFAHERVAEVEGTLRRPLWLAIIAVVGRRLSVGLPGVEPFMRFVFYGRHQQAIGLDAAAAVLALVTLAGGFGAAYLVYGPARRGAALVAEALLPLRVAAAGFYVERLTELTAQPLLAIAGRVAAFDDEVTTPIETSVGESVDYAAAGLALVRNARFTRYLAGSLVVIAILALLSVLAATGHLWVHLI